MAEKSDTVPVYFALVQVKFNNIENIAENIAIIQDRFRKKDFADYYKNSTASFVFQMQPSEIMPTPTQEDSYHFFDMKRENGFILQKNALTLQTTTYENRESFFSQLIEGLSIIHEILTLNYIDRIGLRHLNAVFPNQKGSFSDDIKSGVLGLSDDDSLSSDPRLSLSYSEGLIEFGTEKAVIRVISQQNIKKITIPQEISTDIMPLKNEVAKHEDKFAIVDIDSFREVRVGFNIEEVRNTLYTLRDAVSGASKFVYKRHNI